MEKKSRATQEKITFIRYVSGKMDTINQTDHHQRIKKKYQRLTEGKTRKKKRREKGGKTKIKEKGSEREI